MMGDVPLTHRMHRMHHMHRMHWSEDGVGDGVGGVGESMMVGIESVVLVTHNVREDSEEGIALVEMYGEGKVFFLWGLDLEEMGALVHDRLKLDVLVDLIGHTAGGQHELLALRPAPVVVEYLGYPGTMGAPYVTHAVVDHVVVPPGSEVEAGFTEHLIRLPPGMSYQVNSFATRIPRSSLGPVANTRAFHGLPDDPSIPVFACFNSLYKIDPDSLAAWLSILSRVPGSVLWLLEPAHTGPGSDGEHAFGHLSDAFEAAGLDFDSRVVFGKHFRHDVHVARLSHATLFLDTHVYNAHTSATDALWAGVPVLTFPGNTFESRVGASLVTAAFSPGRQEWASHFVVPSWEAYVDFGVRWGLAASGVSEAEDDLVLYRQVTTYFEGQGLSGSLLFDHDGWVRAFEEELIRAL